MTEELEYKGKIEIIGKRKKGPLGEEPDNNRPLQGHEIIVKFDGKEIPFLQNADVWLSATNPPFVVLKFMPIELDIKLDDVEVFVRRKKEL